MPLIRSADSILTGTLVSLIHALALDLNRDVNASAGDGADAKTGIVDWQASLVPALHVAGEGGRHGRVAVVSLLISILTTIVEIISLSRGLQLLCLRFSLLDSLGRGLRASALATSSLVETCAVWYGLAFQSQTRTSLTRALGAAAALLGFLASLADVAVEGSSCRAHGSGLPLELRVD